MIVDLSTYPYNSVNFCFRISMLPWDNSYFVVSGWLFLYYYVISHFTPISALCPTFNFYLYLYCCTSVTECTHLSLYLKRQLAAKTCDFLLERLFFCPWQKILLYLLTPEREKQEREGEVGERKGIESKRENVRKIYPNQESNPWHWCTGQHSNQRGHTTQRRKFYLFTGKPKDTAPELALNNDPCHQDCQLIFFWSIDALVFLSPPFIIHLLCFLGSSIVRTI